MNDNDKIWQRLQNITRRITLKVGDDTGTYQTHQTEGYAGEVRDGIPRVQEFGSSSMPLPGAEGVTVSTNAGYHGTGAIINTNDPRYRVKNQKPGEHSIYMVDGAAADGTGGTVRTLLSGALGWITTLFGKTINIGDSSAQTMNIGTTSESLTINVGSSHVTLNVTGQNINITGSTGDIIINGVSLVNHVHSGVMAGGDDTGPPV